MVNPQRNHGVDGPAGQPGEDELDDILERVHGQRHHRGEGDQVQAHLVRHDQLAQLHGPAPVEQAFAVLAGLVDRLEKLLAERSTPG